MDIKSEHIQKFAKQMDKHISNHNDKKGWKDKDVWWYFSQLVKGVRELEEDLTAKSSSNVTDKAVNIANLAMIVSVIRQGKKRR